MASSFFNESMTVFDELSMLGESIEQFTPGSENDIHDSLDGTISFSDYETDDRRVGELDLETEPTDSNYEGEGGTTQITDDPIYPEGDSIYANGETGELAEYPDSNYEGGGGTTQITDDPNYPEGDSIYANGETGELAEYPDSNYERRGWNNTDNR